MKMEKNNEGIILSLNKRFYNDGSITSGMKEFNKVCKVTKTGKKGEHIIQFSGDDLSELEEIALEFANFVLFLTKSS